MTARIADAALFSPAWTSTAGAEVYPFPPFGTDTDVMTPPETVATACAPLPPPPTKVSVGVPVKLVPPLTTVTDATPSPPSDATAAAPVPPADAAKLIVGLLL